MGAVFFSNADINFHSSDVAVKSSVSELNTGDTAGMVPGNWGVR